MREQDPSPSPRRLPCPVSGARGLISGWVVRASCEAPAPRAPCVRSTHAPPLDRQRLNVLLRGPAPRIGARARRALHRDRVDTHESDVADPELEVQRRDAALEPARARGSSPERGAFSAPLDGTRRACVREGAPYEVGSGWRARLSAQASQ